MRRPAWLGCLLRTAPVVAVVLGSIAACGEDDPDSGADGLDLPERAALIPPDEVDGRELRTLEAQPFPIVQGDVLRGDHAPSTTAATEVDGAVVAVTETPSAVFNELRGPLEDRGRPGPPVDGRPSWLTYSSTLRPHAVAVEVEGSVIEISSRAVPVPELAEIAADVRTPIDEQGSLPGDVIGVLRADRDRLSTVASYEPPEGLLRGPVAIFTTTPAEQAVYLALAHMDPRQSIDLRTESSCCANEIMRPARHVTVRGVEATIASLTTASKVLVVPGDPGIVAVSGGTRSWDDAIPSDAELIAIAEASRPAAQAELVARVEARHDAALADAVAEIRRREETLGREVLTDLVLDDHPMVISHGPGVRPSPPDEVAPDPALCVVYLPEHLNAGPPIPTCVHQDEPTEPIHRATTVASESVYVGSVRHDVARVALEFPEGSLDSTLVDVPPAAGVGVERVFVIVTSITEQVEISGDDLPHGMAEAAFVAYDADGSEVDRVPLFSHLQDASGSSRS